MMVCSRMAVCEPKASLSLVGLMQSMETQAAMTKMEMQHVKNMLVVEGTPVLEVADEVAVSLADRIIPRRRLNMGFRETIIDRFFKRVRILFFQLDFEYGSQVLV